jgi:lipase chaperone LimK
MKRRWLISSVIALAGIACFLALRRLEEPFPHALARALTLAPAPQAEVAQPQSGPVGPRPPSLRGTQVDGDLPTDRRGDLVVGPEVRRFFDYFLSATGEEPIEKIRARTVSEIHRRLRPTAANDAVVLLDRYLEYRERAAALDPADPNDLEAQFAALEEVRREVFGERDAVALFGDEEDASRVALERRRIAEDPRLTAEEKERALEEAEARLPEPEREARAEAVSALRLWQDEQKLRANGASPEELRGLRESRFGKEAADRLEELDQAHDAWRDRVSRFQSGKAAIESDPSLTSDQRASAVDQLLQASFSSTEQIRVHAVLGDAAASAPTH